MAWTNILSQSRDHGQAQGVAPRFGSRSQVGAEGGDGRCGSGRRRRQGRPRPRAVCQWWRGPRVKAGDDADHGAQLAEERFAGPVPGGGGGHVQPSHTLAQLTHPRRSRRAPSAHGAGDKVQHGGAISGEAAELLHVARRGTGRVCCHRGQRGAEAFGFLEQIEEQQPCGRGQQRVGVVEAGGGGEGDRRGRPESACGHAGGVVGEGPVGRGQGRPFTGAGPEEPGTGDEDALQQAAREHQTGPPRRIGGAERQPNRNQQGH